MHFQNSENNIFCHHSNVNPHSSLLEYRLEKGPLSMLVRSNRKTQNINTLLPLDAYLESLLIKSGKSDSLPAFTSTDYTKIETQVTSAPLLNNTTIYNAKTA